MYTLCMVDFTTAQVKELLKMAKESNHCRNDDFKEFDPITYLETRYLKTTDQFRFLFPLQKYHEIFTQLFSDCKDKLRILEYGCGPVIMYVISAAPSASEIVMADKVPECLDELKRWIHQDRRAFDWTTHFDHVVQTLEGKGEKEAREREMEVRKKIKAVVHCDIFEDNPIESGYEGPYDIIMANGCIDGACKSIEEFNAGVIKVTRLLKPGGNLIMTTNSCNHLGRCYTYAAGQGESLTKFPFVSITREFLLATVENAGYTNLYIDECDDFKEAVASGTVGPWAVHQPDDFRGFLFICATKKP